MRQINPQLNTRRALACVLAVLLLSAMCASALSLPVSAVESGTCGQDLSWSFFAGTLTITGKGAMTDYTELEMAPWYEFREEITRVIFPKDMTSVGNLAFYGCKNLLTVILPNSVTRIGNYAFTGCESISMLDLGDGVTSIGKLAFYECKALQTVQLPYTLESVGDQAFYLCESLKTIKVQSNVLEMGHSVFAYCKGLIVAEISARLNSLPEWTFYGCEQLNIVTLPETIHATENNAFKSCDMLTTVYYGGTEESATELKQSVAVDVPEFQIYGHVGPGAISDTNSSAVIRDNADGTQTQYNVSVSENKNMTVVVEMEHTRDPNAADGGTYDSDISVTIEDPEGWKSATGAVLDSLKFLNEATSNGATVESLDVTVYMKKDEAPDGEFLQKLAGRDTKVTIVSPSGSSWKVDCSDSKPTDITGDCNYSYELSPSDEKVTEQLKTVDCYQLTFEQSANVNAEVLIQLPQIPAHSNAYLYQVENDGSMTRLQATVVDQNGNAHFYLASVNKDTEYIVGVNVPGENADDAIIPDELLPQYGSAVDRLQKIDYVITGHESSWGLNAAQVTWIMLGVLAVCIIIVGTVMAVWNQRRLKRGYVPDMSEYEDPIPVGATAAGAAVAPMVAYEAVGSAEAEEPAEPAEPAEPIEADEAADETAAEESEA